MYPRKLCNCGNYNWLEIVERLDREGTRKCQLFVPGASITCDCLCLWVKKAARKKVRMDCYVLNFSNIYGSASDSLKDLPEEIWT